MICLAGQTASVPVGVPAMLGEASKLGMNIAKSSTKRAKTQLER